MKKILLGLGTLASTIAPVAAVVACGTGNPLNKHYTISMSPDVSTPTQANVIVKLKGYISNSIADEIKSIIAESITEKNKGTLTYTTMHIEIQDDTDSTHKQTIDITNVPLDADHKDLTSTIAMMGSNFDTLITSAKTNPDLAKFFVQSTPGTGTGSTGGSDGGSPEGSELFGGTDQSVNQVHTQLKTGAIRSYFVAHKTKERYAQIFASAKTGVTMGELGFTVDSSHEPSIITDLKAKGKTYTWTFNVNPFVINGVNDYLWIKPILTVEDQSVEEDYGFDVIPATGNAINTDQGDLDAFAFPDLSTHYSSLSQAQIVTNFGGAEHICAMNDIGISGITVPHDCTLSFTVKAYSGTGDLVVVPRIYKTSETTVQKIFAEQHVKVKRVVDISAMKNKLNTHTFHSTTLFALNFRNAINALNKSRMTIGDLETALGVDLGISTTNKAKYDLQLTFSNLPYSRVDNTKSINFTIIPKASEHGVTLTNNTGSITFTSKLIDTAALFVLLHKNPLVSNFDPSKVGIRKGDKITYANPEQERFPVSSILGFDAATSPVARYTALGYAKVIVTLTGDWSPSSTTTTISITLDLQEELAKDPAAPLTDRFSITFNP